MEWPNSKRSRRAADGKQRGMSFSGRMRALSELVASDVLPQSAKMSLSDGLLSQDPAVSAAFDSYEASGNSSSLRGACRASARRKGGHLPLA
jgi:hypothetical protein